MKLTTKTQVVNPEMLHLDREGFRCLNWVRELRAQRKARCNGTKENRVIYWLHANTYYTDNMAAI